MKKTPITNYFIFALASIFVALGAFLFATENQGFEIKGNDQNSPNGSAININAGPVSPITGEGCANAGSRLFGVMLAGDAITRPLSGIGQADLVIEMPVITNGITRYLAIYGCEQPPEMGSVRSARDDYIPLAEGLDVIYAHWGGSHFALDELKGDVIDNINALINPNKAYFRKPGIPEPHNGFTTYASLKAAAEKLTYRLTNELEPYPHKEKEDSITAAKAKLTIPYPGPFKVEWAYDPATNTYARFKGGTPEIDANTKEQIRAKVIAVLRTAIRQVEGQYNDVKVVGGGEGVLYQDGKVWPMKWRKDTNKAKLKFFDESGTEVLLEPGKAWIQYVELGANLTYNAEKQ